MDCRGRWQRLLRSGTGGCLPPMNLPSQRLQPLFYLFLSPFPISVHIAILIQSSPPPTRLSSRIHEAIPHIPCPYPSLPHTTHFSVSPDLRHHTRNTSEKGRRTTVQNRFRPPPHKVTSKPSHVAHQKHMHLLELLQTQRLELALPRNGHCVDQGGKNSVGHKQRHKHHRP